MLVSTSSSASGWIINRRRAVSCHRGWGAPPHGRRLSVPGSRSRSGGHAPRPAAVATLAARRRLRDWRPWHPARCLSLARPRARHVVSDLLGALSPGIRDDWLRPCRCAGPRTTWPPCVRPPLHRPRPARSVAGVRMYHDAKNNDTKGTDRQG